MAEAPSPRPLPPERDLYGKDDLHYLSFSAPVPTLPFIDIHDYDLPYGGKNFLHDTFAKSQTTPSPFQFKGSTVKKEGANLLSCLTGVKNDVTRHKHWVPGCGRVRCKYDQQFTEEAVKQLEDLLDGKKKRSSKSGSQRSRRSYVCYMVDECVDTGDLEGLVFDFDADSDTTVAQGSSSSSSDEDDSPEKKPGVMDKSPNEYLALIKDSMSRIGLRTQMLHDLSLGECPPREAPASAPARSQGQGSAAAAAQEADSPYMSHTSISVKQARKLVGAMHTDEQAIDLRDLLSWMEQLGAMAEEKSKEYESRQSLKPESTEQMKSRLQNVGGSDWRLPASPPIALQLANEDLQNRLANLYQEKNFLNNKIQSLRKEDLDESQNMPQEFMSALRSLEEDYELLGDSVSQNLESAERLEERYQLLEQQLNATGNSAGKHLHDMVKVKNLLGPDAVEGLQKLPPSRPDSALSEAEKTTREVTEDPNKKPRKSRSPEAMREGGEGAASKPPIRIQSKVYPRKSPSPKLGKGDDDRRSPSPLSASGSQTPDSRSTTRSETASQGKNLIQIIQDDKTKIIESRDDGSDKRVRRPARKDKAVQTDSITVSSLMDDHRDFADEPHVSTTHLEVKAAEKPEKPPTPVPTPKPTVADKVSARPETPTTTPTSSPATPATGSPSESPALDGDSSKVNMLHKELEKSKKQLNYYRTRNWAEKHEAHAVPIPVTATRRQEEPLAPEGDVGLIFVYNPTSGFHTMLSSGDVGQSKNKGSLIRGSTIYHHDKPMSAPAGLSRSGMPMSVSTSNRVVSASQVMKLIAKRREQQQAAKK